MARAASAFLAAILSATVLVGAGGQGQPSVTTLMEVYASGKFDEAVNQAAALRDLGPFRLRFVQDTPAWIASRPDLSSGRRAAAAAFLVELTQARLESDWGRLTDLIEWMCLRLRTSGAPTPFERAWHRASMALAGRARARVWLLGEFPQLPHQPPRTRKPPPPKVDNPSPRHLMHALERFPDDPHLRLGRVVAWTWGRDQEPIRNARQRRVSAMSFIGQAQLEALTSLRPLFEDQAVGAEALIRAGLIHFSVADHRAALQVYEQSQPLARDPATRYLGFFLAGRALEALQRPSDAMRAYSQALQVTPSAESATIALSSLQFAGASREAAVARIAGTLGRTSATDPGRLLGYGSFIHWPQLRDTMRAELGLAR